VTCEIQDFQDGISLSSWIWKILLFVTRPFSESKFASANQISSKSDELWLRYNKGPFTVHYLRWRIPPFMRQCWGLPHKLARCMSPQGLGKLVNAALLSLINEACVNVCCATLLPSELVGPACVQARSSNPRNRSCGPSGKGSGEEGILSDVVPVYLYCPAFSVSVSPGV